MARRSRFVLLVVAAALVAAGSLAGPMNMAGAAPVKRTAGVGPTVYVGNLTPGQLGLLRQSGLDSEDIATQPAGATAKSGRIGVEVVASRGLAAKLVAQGVPLTEKKVDGERVSQRLQAQAEPTVFRHYGGPGGIADELKQVALDHPGLTKLEAIGHTVNGQTIYAVKLTRNARSVRDGSRPSVLYSAAQHAREWITPEMDRRLLHYLIDGYTNGDQKIRRLVNTTELWFVPVANPDGYDFTFTDGNRFWRKNLRDNDGDGQITAQDGVDPNRNFPAKWGYDNEGSSPSFGSETYRGTAPSSEPETQALDGLLRRIRFTFLINYHSAAELLLYGVGWQVSTRSPDDLICEALAGDDAHPAVPGYDPDQSRRALHHQRRDRRPGQRSVRHARLHPGDGDV